MPSRSFSFSFLLRPAGALLALAFLAGRPLLAAASAPLDLGDGLEYLRVRSPADPALKTLGGRPQALILDLRHVTAGELGPEFLRPALAARPDGLPLFVLVGPDTPPGVARAVAETGRGVVSFGVVGSDPAPRVAVRTSVEDDRKAFAAADNGAPFTQLVSGKVEKERFDEATLVSEFNNGNTDPEPPEAPDPSATKPDGGTEAPPPLIDRVAQRAIHLYRALRALKP
jgi:hypothetical protein